MVELQIWCRAGSADERPGEAGLAHFHEHMLFKGTQRRGVGQIASEIEGAGGRINAYTSFDVTVYHATLPSDQLEIGIDVLTDAVLHSTFDPEEIRREIEVVLEEIRRGEDSPFQVLGNALFEQAFRTHPYRAPILGPPESVAAFDRARVRGFFDRWYAPDQLTVVAVGDFDRELLLARLREAFAGAAPSLAKRERAPEPPQRGLRSFVLARSFERANLELAWRGLELAHPDAALLDLLAFVLGCGESSRLVQRVKERDEIVDRIDASCFTPLDPGLFSISIETDSERSGDAIAAAVREVERLRRELVSEEELDKARANFFATEHFARESVSGLAQKLGGFELWRATTARRRATSRACAARHPRSCCAWRASTWRPRRSRWEPCCRRPRPQLSRTCRSRRPWRRAPARSSAASRCRRAARRRVRLGATRSRIGRGST